MARSDDETKRTNVVDLPGVRDKRIVDLADRYELAITTVNAATRGEFALGERREALSRAFNALRDAYRILESGDVPPDDYHRG